MNRRGVRLLHLTDVVTIYVTLFAITGLMILVRDEFNAEAYLSRYAWSYAIVALVHLAVFSFGGLYDRERRLGMRPGGARIVTLVWFASLLVGLVSWLMGDSLIPRSVLIVYGVVGPLGVGANRWLSRWLRFRAEGPARVLLVGDQDAVELATEHVRQSADRIAVAGNTDTAEGLERRVVDSGATDVLLLGGDELGAVYADSLPALERDGIGTLQVVRPQDSLLGLRYVGEIGGMPFVPLSTHVLTPSQARLKRWMDVAVLIVTAPITVPLTVFTTLYVAMVGGRPLLFIQERAGRDGAEFRMYKFRTMRTDAEAATGPVQATTDDPRITRGLNWIRQTRLDELPQLLNVLRGQMTIVGPRPERPEELAHYELEIPGYRRRHQAPPGITGLAQVYGRYHTHIEYKLGHDLHYLANWTPILDLQIMIRTAWVIVSRRL